MVEKFFKFMLFSLREKTFASQKTGSRHFYSCPPKENSPLCSYHPQAEENFSFLRSSSIFLKIYSSPKERGRDGGRGNYVILITDHIKTAFDFTEVSGPDGDPAMYLTLFFPMLPFDPPENIRKPLVF